MGILFRLLILIVVLSGIGFLINLYNAFYVTPAESRGDPDAASSAEERVSGIPVRLTIPALSVDTAVQKVGLTKAGKMGAPTNFTDVAWYKYGFIPGEEGNTVMAGHLDNAVGLPAVFKDLQRLRPGDDIFVRNSEGEEFHFKVTYTKSLPYDTDVTGDIFGPSIASNLVLITCEGDWNQSLRSYSDRFVVFSTLVE